MDGKAQQQPSSSSPGGAADGVDNLKLFVGQVPRAFTEHELLPLFQQFGHIQHLSILRDRLTGVSKGCAFLTYSTRQSADACVAALHDKHVLGEMSNPMQIRPASTVRKQQEERKLFVGMLSKNLAESEIRALFEPYGVVDDVVVLRNTDGTSKGCAFVKMDGRGSAQNAVAHLHQSRTMDGCRWPLVVKFADTERDKVAKRMHAHMEYFFPFNSFNMPGSVQPQGAPMQPLLFPGQSLGPPLAPPPFAPPPSRFAPLPSSPNGSSPMYPGAFNGHASMGPMGATRPTEGPEGANLFIYHLPQEFTDATLASTFMPFGKVISAKVFVDSVTRQSKCFGFVSFDNPMSAQRAIEMMNGFQVGTKRLKVALKKLKLALPPMAQPMHQPMPYY